MTYCKYCGKKIDEVPLYEDQREACDDCWEIIKLNTIPKLTFFGLIRKIISFLLIIFMIGAGIYTIYEIVLWLTIVST